MVARPWSSSRLSCGERLLLRCDGNAGNSFPTKQGKDQAERPLIELSGTIDSKDDDYDDDENGDENRVKEVKLLCDSARPLLEACMNSDQPVVVPYPVECTGDADIDEFKAILEKHKGGSPVHIHFELNGHACVMELGHQWKVQASPQFNKDVDAWVKARMAARRSS